MRRNLPALVRILIAVAAGALLNTGACWVFAAFGDCTHSEFRYEMDLTAAEARFVGPRLTTSDPPWTTRTWLHCWGFGARCELISESLWMDSKLGMSDSTPYNRTLVVGRTGWPWPALAWEEAWPRSLSGHLGALSWTREGINAGFNGRFSAYINRRLPVRPEWPGFAANTLVFSAVLWGAAHGWRAVLRARRRARGCCPACGYAVAGLNACPECGAPTAPAATIGRGQETASPR